MSTALVLIDDPAQLRSGVAEALTVARDLGEPVALCLAEPSPQVLAALGEYGVSRVLLARIEPEQRHLAAVAGEVIARAVARLQPLAVLATSSFANKEVVARAAWATGSGLLVDVSAVEVRDCQVVGHKRAFAGTWQSSCAVTSPTAVLTLSPNAVVATPAGQQVRTEVEDMDVEIEVPGGLQVASRTVHAGSLDAAGVSRPALAEAPIVVAGGRGTAGDFSAVEDLADALGAAIGTTRDCVDEGWIGHDAQIGQTGVTIAPRLYIGAGISGAPHHHGGMQASGTIVAVNTDADAPLAEIADVVVVGDLHEVLPAAAETIRHHRGES